MLVGILLRALARDFQVVFRELTPSRVSRNQFVRGKKLWGATLSLMLSVFHNSTTAYLALS